MASNGFQFICPKCGYEQTRESIKYPAYCPACLKACAAKEFQKMNLKESNNDNASNDRTSL